MPVIMDAVRMGRSLARIAHEIVERNRNTERLALVGIRTRGDVLARRLSQQLQQITNEPVATGALDITLYRDDLMRHAVGPQPLVRRTEIPFSIDNRKILLVDDGSSAVSLPEVPLLGVLPGIVGSLQANEALKRAEELIRQAT